MKLKNSVVLIGMETYKSKKTEKEYAKVLLVDEGGTDAITVLTDDFTIMSFPLYSKIKAVFDYSDKYSKLSLLAYELVK